MRKHIKYIALAVTFISFNVCAGESNNSEIVQIEQRDDGVVKLQVSHGSYSGLPGCSFSGGAFLFDGSTSAGKNMLSIAMSAFMANKNVNIQVNTCYAFSNNADTQLGKVERISVVK